MDIVSGFGLFLDDMLRFLEGSANSPLSYVPIFFIYTVLAAVILPLPVEIGLFFSPGTPVLVKVLVMGLGKMLGSIFVFFIGLKVGDRIRSWSSKWKWFDRLVNGCEWMVSKFHYVGLYIILCIPLMTDTVPLYLFSMFNETGVLKMKWFAVVSFLGGITRGLIVFAFFALLNIKLV